VRLLCCLLVVALVRAADDPNTLRSATLALQRGDYPATEQILTVALRGNPNQPAALSLLGVTLDFQQRMREAAEAHFKAVSQAPRSPDILANYGNHLLSTGKDAEAKAMFLRATAVEPGHPGANRELTRIALEAKAPAEALRYVNRISPDVLSGDAGLQFSKGLALAALKQAPEAEKSFSRAMELDPSNGNVLMNLALAAMQAGHGERARAVLTAAKSQSPDNVEILYRLAWVNSQLGRHEDAVTLLAQVMQLNPKHVEGLHLLAVTTSELRAYADSADAWDRYVALQPGDAVARRERGFANFLRGEIQLGLADLRWYVKQRPQDATGLYQLALAEGLDNPEQGRARLDVALRIKPDFTAARSERGQIHYQAGRFQLARTDLELAAQQQPNDAYTLDRLGQTYASLDRPADALRVLRKAAQLAPNNSTIFLHLGRVLASAGMTEESAAAMERFRQLGPVKGQQVPEGLVSYLGMTPAQRRADYRMRVEKTVRESPKDPEAHLRHLKMLLEEGSDPAVPAQHLLELPVNAAVLLQAGTALLDTQQFALAEKVLERAQQSRPSTATALQFARAKIRTEGASAGLAILGTVPERERRAAYFLARAEMLETASPAEAKTAVEVGLGLLPLLSDEYRQAAGILARIGDRTALEEVALIAAANLPKDREMMLLKSATSLWLGKVAEAEAGLAAIRASWPEWPAAWVVEGYLRRSQGKFEEAKVAFQTAAQLGSTREIGAESTWFLRLLTSPVANW